MAIFDDVFPLGLGTTRFPISGPNDLNGIEQAARIVADALNAGVNYIDTAYPYSAGMAKTALRMAFSETTNPFGVTVKVSPGDCKTADEARKSVEAQLEAMGLNRATYFVCWNINSYAAVENIIRPGGIYECARKLKDEGVIEYICCSSHAMPKDNIRIIESGLFEGITLSFNFLNAPGILPVLGTAERCGVGVVVMNPLGGGLVPHNPDFFDFTRSTGDVNVCEAALRFVYAHPAVKVVLSGVSSREELAANIQAFAKPDAESREQRLNRVLASVTDIEGFCTGCRYCDGCPAGINIVGIMYKRNWLLFGSTLHYNRYDDELNTNIKLFWGSVVATGVGEWFPNDAENPCTRCGVCEGKCTQRLRIMDAVSDMYRRAASVGYSRTSRKARVAELLHNKGYKRVGLYPNGGFAQLVMALYAEQFGKPCFEWLLFNSDQRQWGNTSEGLDVHGPMEIETLRPDIIIVSTYRHDEEIYRSLRKYGGMRLEKLHKPTDVPWIF